MNLQARTRSACHKHQIWLELLAETSVQRFVPKESRGKLKMHSLTMLLIAVSCGFYAKLPKASEELGYTFRYGSKSTWKIDASFATRNLMLLLENGISMTWPKLPGWEDQTEHRWAPWCRPCLQRANSSSTADISPRGKRVFRGVSYLESLYS